MFLQAVLSMASMQSFAPYELVDRVNKCLDEYFFDKGSLAVSDLPGGLSPSHNMLIEQNGDRFVLRLQGLGVAQDDLEREFFAADSAASNGISPQILWHEADHSAFLMRFIADEHLTIASAKAPENILEGLEFGLLCFGLVLKQAGSGGGGNRG